MITAVAIIVVAVVSFFVGAAIGAAHERENVLQFLAIVQVKHRDARVDVDTDLETTRIVTISLRACAATIDETAKRIATGDHVGAAIAARKAGRHGRA